ncbi:hypothetical protein KGQ55_00700 [Patescibacteria group bacterium]|nr:hypothetical protein [Patescibacteria group bacterium]
MDIHTTGNESIVHLFTFSWMDEAFARLGCPVHIHIDDDGPAGAFDESHVLPFLKSMSRDLIPKACTWEIGSHGRIPSQTLLDRSVVLKLWLRSVWDGTTAQSNARSLSKPAAFKRLGHLHAPFGGYYTWQKKPGSAVKAGETYAYVFQPWNGIRRKAVAEFDFVLLGIYGADATAAHEQIGCFAADPV